MDRSVQTAFLILFTFSSFAQVDMVITKELQGDETTTVKLEDIIVVQDDGGYDVTFKNTNAQTMTFQKSKISVVAYGTEFMRKSNVKISVINPNVKIGGRYKVDKFQINYDNPYLLNQFIVLEKENMSIEEGYKLLKTWINITWNTPREVIKADLENEYVRIKGIETFFCSTVGNLLKTRICKDLYYTFSFEFKDNKIKMQLTALEERVQGSPNTALEVYLYQWRDVRPEYGDRINLKTGEVTLQSDYQDQYTRYLNSLGHSLKDYLNNPKEIRNDDW